MILDWLLKLLIFSLYIPEPSIKCYDCTIDTNTTKTVNDIPDCVVNEYNLGNVITCPSSNHFCMSVHVGMYTNVL